MLNFLINRVAMYGSVPLTIIASTRLVFVSDDVHICIVSMAMLGGWTSMS